MAFLLFTGLLIFALNGIVWLGIRSERMRQQRLARLALENLNRGPSIRSYYQKGRYR